MERPTSKIGIAEVHRHNDEENIIVWRDAYYVLSSRDIVSCCIIIIILLAALRGFSCTEK